MLARERFRLPDPAPPHAEPDLSLRGAITSLFDNLDRQAGSSFHKIYDKWKVIAGENAAAHSRPGRLAGDVLYVYVDSSSWMAEMTRYHADNILHNIQREFGPSTVKKVRFQVGQVAAGQSS